MPTALMLPYFAQLMPIIRHQPIFRHDSFGTASLLQQKSTLVKV
jgi:hypothetical protein